MLDNDRSASDSKHYTRQSPEYGVLSTQMATAVGIASFMMIITIAGMVFSANTPLAEFGMMLYETFALLGVLIFGGLISLGRWLGLSGVGNENYPTAILGSAICIFAYSWFGGMILSMVNASVFPAVLGITSIITILITLAAMGVVYATDRNLEPVGKYSASCFLVGIGFALVGSFFSPLLIGAFVFFLLGFILDLVYEIWMVSDGRRSPFANGIAVYVAFAGTFVHILQIVARAYMEE